MDQPFDTDVMDDLLADHSDASTYDGFDGYDEIDEEGFEDTYADEMDDFAESETSYEDHSFDQGNFYESLQDDALENNQFDDELFTTDFWNDSIDHAAEHRKNQRESNRPTHEKGQRRRGMDQGGEAGDQRRRHTRKRPPGHRGPWPPQKKSFDDEFYGEEAIALTDDMDSMGDLQHEASPPAVPNTFDAMEEAIADALELADGDEFLRRIERNVRQAANVARQVSQTAPGRAATSPQVQAIARVASFVRRLLTRGADEFEALDEMLSFATSHNAVDTTAPIIAGLALRTAMPQASRLNRATRRQLVRSVRQSTQLLARQRGTAAIRAIPRVVRSVHRTAQRRRLPVQQLPQTVQRTTARIAQNPQLLHRLSRPSQTSSQVRTIRPTAGHPQRLMIHGPVEIIVRSLS